MIHISDTGVPSLMTNMHAPKILKKKAPPAPLLLDEPLISINMEPTKEVDPLSYDESASEASFADDSGFEMLPLLENLGDSLTSTPRVSLGPPDQCETVQVKEDPDGNISIKEEPKDRMNTSLNKSGREILAEALNAIKFLCSKCPFRANDKDEVSRHFEVVHSRYLHSRPRPCDKCEFIGKSVRDIALHKKLKHPRSTLPLEILPTGELKCAYCDFTSTNKNNIRQHSRVHTSEKIFGCDRCPYKSLSKACVMQHMKRHSARKSKKYKLKCKLCGFAERTEEMLSRHMTLHGEGEMKQCQLCPYKTPFTRILSQHTRFCHNIISQKSWERKAKWESKRESDTSENYDFTQKELDEDSELTDDAGKRIIILPQKSYMGKKRGRKPKNWHIENKLNSKPKVSKKSGGKTDEELSEDSVSEDSQSNEEDLYVPQRHVRLQTLGVRRSTRSRRTVVTNSGNEIDDDAEVGNLEVRPITRGVAKRGRGRPRKDSLDPEYKTYQPIKRRRMSYNELENDIEQTEQPSEPSESISVEEHQPASNDLEEQGANTLTDNSNTLLATVDNDDKEMPTEALKEHDETKEFTESEEPKAQSDTDTKHDSEEELEGDNQNEKTEVEEQVNHLQDDTSQGTESRDDKQSKVDSSSSSDSDETSSDDSSSDSESSEDSSSDKESANSSAETEDCSSQPVMQQNKEMSDNEVSSEQPSLSTNDKIVNEDSQANDKIVNEDSQASSQANDKIVNEDSQASSQANDKIVNDDSQASSQANDKIVNEDSQASSQANDKIVDEDSQASSQANDKIVDEDSQASSQANDKIVNEDSQASSQANDKIVDEDSQASSEAKDEVEAESGHKSGIEEKNESTNSSARSSPSILVLKRYGDGDQFSCIQK